MREKMTKNEIQTLFLPQATWFAKECHIQILSLFKSHTLLLCSLKLQGSGGSVVKRTGLWKAVNSNPSSAKLPRLGP